jgi:hypothetical protein
MPDPQHKAPHIRRTVTGHDAEGNAMVWIDGPAAAAISRVQQNSVPSTHMR